MANSTVTPRHGGRDRPYELTTAELLAWAPHGSVRLRLQDRAWPWLDWIASVASLRAVYGYIDLRRGW